jgi:hypothetical protein
MQSIHKAAGRIKARGQGWNNGDMCISCGLQDIEEADITANSHPVDPATNNLDQRLRSIICEKRVHDMGIVMRESNSLPKSQRKKNP